jgi:hypothetical protein
MRANASFPCDYAKACYVKYAVFVLHWSQTKAAIVIGLNVGTVCHVVKGRRFPSSIPLPF